jgi:hypothetical protein
MASMNYFLNNIYQTLTPNKQIGEKNVSTVMLTNSNNINNPPPFFRSLNPVKVSNFFSTSDIRRVTLVNNWGYVLS